MKSSFSQEKSKGREKQRNVTIQQFGVRTDDITVSEAEAFQKRRTPVTSTQVNSFSSPE